MWANGASICRGEALSDQVRQLPAQEGVASARANSRSAQEEELNTHGSHLSAQEEVLNVQGCICMPERKG